MYHIQINLRSFIFLAYSLLSLTCIAQSDFRPGYVIKNNQDSINGFVSYGSGKANSERCFFKETKKDNHISFTPEDIKAYGFLNDKHHESRNLPAEFKSTDPSIDKVSGGKVFVTVLAKGPLGLYRYRKFYFLDKNGLIILPFPESKLVHTKNGDMYQKDHRYIDILNTFLEDSPLKANRTGYNEGPLTKLINDYNHFKGHQLVETNKKPFLKLHIGVFYGFVRSTMKMDLIHKVSFAPSTSVVGGLGFEVSSPRIYDRMFLSIEGWYTSIFYQDYLEKTVTGDIVRQDTFIDASFFKAPIGFRYNILSQSNTPYVKLGISFYFMRSTSIRILEEIERSGNIIVTEEDFGEDYRIKNPRGIWFSLGYDRQVYRNMKVFGEFRLEKSNGFIGTPIQNFSSSVDYNLLLGFRF